VSSTCFVFLITYHRLTCDVWTRYDYTLVGNPDLLGEHICTLDDLCKDRSFAAFKPGSPDSRNELKLDRELTTPTRPEESCFLSVTLTNVNSDVDFEQVQILRSKDLSNEQTQMANEDAERKLKNQQRRMIHLTDVAANVHDMQSDVSDMKSRMDNIESKLDQLLLRK
jgi:hypothetical protein